MSCKFYESSPGHYGSCSAKREAARKESGRGSQREQDGYIEYGEYREYSCDSGSSRCQNCPYYGNKKGDGCYVTTACVIAKGLPDNCYELETLRIFRDEYVQKQPTGEADIALYYNIAPEIVKKINELPEGNEIFCELYQKLILPCVKLIEEKEYLKAYKLYKNVMLQLKDEYEIN